jgi:hypothetical protein
MKEKQRRVIGRLVHIEVDAAPFPARRSEETRQLLMDARLHTRLGAKSNDNGNLVAGHDGHCRVSQNSAILGERQKHVNWHPALAKHDET